MMPREATGQLRRLANGWEARIRLGPKSRLWFALETCRTEAEAEERCRAMAQIAKRLRLARRTDQLPKLLKMAATTRPGRPWDAIIAAVDDLCGGPASDDASPPLTLAKFAEQWTDGSLHRKHPDHVRRKKHVDGDERILATYINPIIGDLLVSDLRLEDFEQVMAGLP